MEVHAALSRDSAHTQTTEDGWRLLAGTLADLHSGGASISATKVYSIVKMYHLVHDESKGS